MNTHQKKYEVLEKAEIWDNLGKTSRSCNSSWAKLRAKTPDNKTFNPVNEPDISATHKRQTIGSGVCTFGCRKFKNTTIHRKALLKIWTYSAATCNAVSRAFLPFQESFKRVRACNHVSYRPWQLVVETNKKNSNWQTRKLSRKQDSKINVGYVEDTHHSTSPHPRQTQDRNLRCFGRTLYKVRRT